MTTLSTSPMNQDEQISATKRKEALDKELTPVLERLMTLGRGKDYQKDVLWIASWLKNSERTVEDLRYVLGPLQEKVSEGYSYEKPMYLLKEGFEAVANRCTVLEGPWEDIVRSMMSVLSSLKHKYGIGPCSIKLNTWMFHMVSDPRLCPNRELRLDMLNLYRTLITIHKNNRKLALESLMTAFMFLDREGERFSFPMTDEIIDFLSEFTCDNYLTLYGAKLAGKLKLSRKKRQEGIVAEPNELKGIIALIKFMGDAANVEYEEFQIQPNYEFHFRCLMDATFGLHFLARHLKKLLQTPELLDVMSTTIMDVIEASVLIGNSKGYLFDYELDCLDRTNKMLDLLSNNNVDKPESSEFMFIFQHKVTRRYTLDDLPIGQEIIRRFPDRISKINSMVSEEFMEEYLFDDNVLIWNILNYSKICN